MKKVSYEDILFADFKCQGFCVSIYASNFMEMQRLIDEAQLVARQDLNPEQYTALFGTFEHEKNLIENFPVAVFLSAQTKMYVPLFKCHEELFVVSTSFHIKPLIKMHQRNKDVAMLSFSESNVKLFQVSIKNVVLLDIFKLPKQDKDYLIIDRYISSLLSDKKPLLVFTGNRKHIDKFKKASIYGNIFNEPFNILQRFKDRDLLKHIFRHLEPYFRKIESKTLERFNTAKIQGKILIEINEILSHALKGQIKALYIAEDKKLWGYLDAHRSKITIHTKQIDSYDDDILDDLSELVLKFKGSVFVLPHSEMPEKNVIFCILRDSYEKIIIAKKLHKTLR
jgi:hypothetical protein